MMTTLELLSQCCRGQEDVTRYTEVIVILRILLANQMGPLRRLQATAGIANLVAAFMLHIMLDPEDNPGHSGQFVQALGRL